MATMNCKWCIEQSHDGDFFCGTEQCACCGLSSRWLKNPNRILTDKGPIIIDEANGTWEFE